MAGSPLLALAASSWEVADLGAKLFRRESPLCLRERDILELDLRLFASREKECRAMDPERWCMLVTDEGTA